MRHARLLPSELAAVTPSAAVAAAATPLAKPARRVAPAAAGEDAALLRQYAADIKADMILHCAEGVVP